MLYQGNAESLAATVIDEESFVPTDLTAKTIHVLIKPSQSTADSDGSVVTLSSGGIAPAITITDVEGGKLTVTFTPTVLAVAALAWWRMDVVEDHKTILYGDFTVMAV